MYTYVSTVPAGAVRREIDGNLYAYSNLHLDVQPGRVTVKGGIETRMMRVSGGRGMQSRKPLTCHLL